MDYEIDDVIFVHQLEEQDLFRLDGEDYRAHRITDDDDLIIIRAECLSDNDDLVTLELHPETKLELLVVA